jgi:hypothetical protein
MDIWGFLRGLIDRDKQAIWSGPVDPERAPGSPAAVTLEAEKHYFRLWLIEMSLPYGGRWFRDYYPAVQSLVQLEYGPQQRPDLPGIVGPSRLPGVTESQLGRVVQMRLPLTPLLPFKGGKVEVEVGLFAAVAKDYAQSFLKVLGAFSETLHVPQLSAALGVAGPLLNGLNEFLGAKMASLEAGFHTAFTGGAQAPNPLRSGYWVTFRDPDNRYLPTPELWVLRDGVSASRTAAGARPLRDVPYLLVQIEATTDRDDFRQLGFMKTFADALAAADEEQRKVLWLRFLTEVRASTDVTDADKKRIQKALKSELEEARAAGLGLAPDDALDRAAAFWDRVTGLDVHAARAESMPSVEETLRAVLD